MSWVRNNVSKSISQQKAFNKSAISYQVDYTNRNESILGISTPQNKIENQSNNKVIEELPTNVYDIKKSALESLDAILYINLKHREDRKEHCLDEIRKIDKYLIKTYRIDAVYDEEIGARGCTASHIKALEYIIENKYWNNVLIIEDDFTFVSNDTDVINQSVSYLINKIQEYDVLLLSQGCVDFKAQNTNDNNIKKVLSSQTTSGYIVNKNYVFTLLSTFKESYNNMKKFGYKPEWCLDQCWKKLMPAGKWFTYKDRIGKQYESYSDIEKKEVNYNC